MFRRCENAFLLANIVLVYFLIYFFKIYKKLPFHALAIMLNPIYNNPFVKNSIENRSTNIQPYLDGVFGIIGSLIAIYLKKKRDYVIIISSEALIQFIGFMVFVIYYGLIIGIVRVFNISDSLENNIFRYIFEVLTLIYDGLSLYLFFNNLDQKFVWGFFIPFSVVWGWHICTSIKTIMASSNRMKDLFNTFFEHLILFIIPFASQIMLHWEITYKAVISLEDKCSSPYLSNPK